MTLDGEFEFLLLSRLFCLRNRLLSSELTVRGFLLAEQGNGTYTRKLFHHSDLIMLSATELRRTKETVLTSQSLHSNIPYWLGLFYIEFIALLDYWNECRYSELQIDQA